MVNSKMEPTLHTVPRESVIISRSALVTALGALVIILDALIDGGTETPLG